MMKKTCTFVIMLLLISFNILAEDIKSGPWRFELKTEHAIVPFIVDLELKNKKITGQIRNGKETIKLENIIYSQGKIRIPMSPYEITLEMEQKSPILMEGKWIRHNKDPKVEIPVTANHGVTERFPVVKINEPQIDLNGKWAVDLRDEEGTVTPGVLIFEQDKEKITGSLLTTTGDYRYFEGHISSDKFEGASFDGMYNYIIRGNVIGGKLQALVLNNFVLRVEGKKKNNASMPDAYAATQITQPLKFSFPNLTGKKVSLRNKKFKNKPVILQFYGSWCPNCLDEMNYLISWYNENKKRGIEIIALAFERSLSEADAKRQLLMVQKKSKVPYTILLAGATAADKPMEKIPGLTNFISFPTTVFLNRKHEVLKVHAGFSGPSTGEFFEQWKKEFNENVDQLLK
jgi:thiol-disulfide isomerase/thioredoxin